MKNFITFILLIFYTVSGKTQTFKYEIYDGKNAALTENFFKVNDGYLYAEPVTNKKVVFSVFGGGMDNIRYGLTIHKLNEKMEEVSEAKLFAGEKKLVSNLYKVFDFGGRTYVLYHDISSEENIAVLKLTEIDPQTASAKTDVNLINFAKSHLEFNEKDVLKKHDPTFRVYVSENKKKLMITAEADADDKDNKTINAWVYDESFKLITEKKIDLKSSNETVSIYSVLCDDAGNIFIAYRQYYGINKKHIILGQDGKIVKDEVQDDMKKLLMVPADTKVQKIIPLNMEGYSVYAMGLSYSAPQNKVFILGAFTDAWNDNITGVFQGFVDLSTMKLSPVKKTSFSKELIEKISEDGYAKKDAKKFGLIRHFAFTYPVRKDGTADIVMNYLEKVTSQGSHSITTTFYGGDCIIGHLVGDNFQFSRIPRDISSPGVLSYLQSATLSTGDNLIVVYNDNESNGEHDIEKKPKPGVVQKSEIYVATIDKNGIVARQRLLKDLDGKSIGLLDHVFIMDPQSFLISIQHLNGLSMSTSKVQLAKVTVK